MPDRGKGSVKELLPRQKMLLLHSCYASKQQETPLRHIEDIRKQLCSKIKMMFSLELFFYVKTIFLIAYLHNLSLKTSLLMFITFI